jgi:hypothetical protein
MGLDTLDEFSPKDTDPVSLGDDAIRLTRAATKQTVGLEHYLDGAHKIPGGAQSTRPAPGRAGRLYFNTDLKVAEYDNGSSWQSPADSKATATILWHSTGYAVGSGQTLEVPFDYIIDDPGGYASTQYHQIVMPPNSMGIVTAFIQLDGTAGGFGGVMTIEQWDPGGSKWYPVAQAYNNQTQFFNATTMVDSRWGQQMHVTFTNASGSTRTILPTALGSSPRFGFAMLGRTA